MRRTVRRLAFVGCAAIVLAALDGRPLLAGGPYAVATSGAFVAWPNGGRDVRFHPDRGGLGPFSHTEALAITREAFAQWEAVPSSTASFVEDDLLPVDADVTNFWEVTFDDSDGRNPVVFDEDGSITALYFGEYAGVLGFGETRANYETGPMHDAWMVLNGRYFGIPVSRAVMLAAATHEVGHFIGLDHSVVNDQVATFADSTGPSPHDTFPRPAVLDVETMAGIIGVQLGTDGTYGLKSGQDTLHRDDIASISTVYPEPWFASTTGTITGRTRTPNGTPYSGVNVIARNLDDPFEDAVSSISGSRTAYPEEDFEAAGAYVLQGLTPGARYAVYVDRLILGFPEKRKTMPGPEEFYSGAGESSDPATDDPAEYFPLVPAAGVPMTGIDIVFNASPSRVIPPEEFVYGFPTGAVPVFPRMPMELCGQRFGHFLLNSDGTLTFFDGAQPLGVHDLFLSGPTRLAGLWADFDPMAGGTISIENAEDSVTISFDDVPTIDGGANTFSMTLTARRGRPMRWTTRYGHLDEPGGFAGYSCGGLATSGYELETDLTALAGRPIDGRGRTAVFEEFASSDNDLDNVTLTYDLPGTFVDPFEPNGSVASARRVTLPFNTAGSFTAVGLDELDVYRFRAKKGQVVIADVVRNEAVLASLELFRVAPNGRDAVSLASTDLYWEPSRIRWTIAEDGDYALAVTGRSTWATGLHARYLLNIASYSGRVLPLGDDDSVEVPLAFAFPYQGANWRSVWVNTDGNLTFGQPDFASTPRDLPRFLNGPPRIAPLFADLDPTGTFTGIEGLVLAEEGTDSLTIRWASVPRYGGWATNSFSVMLRRDGSVSMDWPLVTRDRNAIAGITEGGGPVHPRRVDLSRSRRLRVAGTTYEDFALSYRFGFPAYQWLGPIDLSFRSVSFARPGGPSGDNDDGDDNNHDDDP